MYAFFTNHITYFQDCRLWIVLTSPQCDEETQSLHLGILGWCLPKVIGYRPFLGAPCLHLPRNSVDIAASTFAGFLEYQPGAASSTLPL